MATTKAVIVAKGTAASRTASRGPAQPPPGRPPNGGWGWIVVLGVSIAYMTNMALFSVYGLLFGGQLQQWGLETTGVAFISSTMTSVQNFSGLMVGPLVKRIGAKAVSLLGGVLTSTGMILSYFATDPWHVFITWGFLVGLGIGLLTPATFLNISSYFTTRRSVAVGLALAGTGLGQILMPHLVRLLLEHYGFHGAVLIMGALALHAIPGCLLYRKPTLSRPRQPEEPDESQPLKPAPTSPPADKASAASAASLASLASLESPASQPKKEAAKEVRCDREAGAMAAFKRFAHSMDLDLLCNMRFMNLAVGTGLIYTTMTSFSMIFPFFLMGSVGLSRTDTATCMSVQSGADLVSRLLLPQLMTHAVCNRARRVRRPSEAGASGPGPGAGLAAKTVMLVGALGSGASRSVMAELHGHTELVAMSAVTGLFRGATVLNQNLVIAEHVPAAKLPSAIGMAMVVKGACVLGLGSALGVVRDMTGSFPLFIHCLTLLIVLTASSWILESLLCPRRRGGATSG